MELRVQGEQSSERLQSTGQSTGEERAGQRENPDDLQRHAVNIQQNADQYMLVKN